MTFNQLCNKLDNVNGVSICGFLPGNVLPGNMNNASVHLSYASIGAISPYMVVLYSDGTIKWDNADKSDFPKEAYDLIDRYRTQVRYKNACDDYQSKRGYDTMTFDQLRFKVEDLNLVGSVLRDSTGDKYLDISIDTASEAIHIYANHSVRYVGNQYNFWRDISNSAKLHKLVNEFVKGDNHMNKKEINEQINEDIQQLAKDLTKKKEIDQSTKITKKIANELGVKLPKSKK